MRGCSPGAGRAGPGSWYSPIHLSQGLGQAGAALGTSLRTGMGWGQAGNMSHDEKHVMGERECVARALTDIIELND